MNSFYKKEIIATSKRIRMVFKNIQVQKFKSFKKITKQLTAQQKKITSKADKTPWEV